jgi:hypothetical protein
MKKDKRITKDEVRAEYKRSDFTGPMMRGKYAQRLREASNIVVLKPEVAAAFPNEDAVNNALKSLIAVAQASTRLTKRASGRGRKRSAA